MSDYSPEKVHMISSAIMNVLLFLITGSTILGLYYMSNSWHSLWAITMLGFSQSSSFTRD